MAVKYKLVQRKDMGKDAAEDAKLYYAQAVSTEDMTLDELCEDIAESSTVTSADVKAVLDRLGWILNKNLSAGRIVQLGELGNFRMTLGSSGTKTVEEFDASMIRKPKITFYPGKRLQDMRKTVSFERVGADDEATEPGTGEGGDGTGPNP